MFSQVILSETVVRKNFDLPINMPNGDQHYLVCTLTADADQQRIVVSNPISGEMETETGWRVATDAEVDALFGLAQSIDQEELLGWFE